MLVPRMQIIVVEDCEIQRTFMCSLINKLGYDAIPAEDGQVALSLVKATGIQIVISDLEMPNLDGIGLTHKIRKLALDHYVHIIMVTNAGESQIRNNALHAGVDDFFTKGESTAMLKARIRTATRAINHANELAQRTRILKASNDRIQDDLRAAAAAQRQLLPELKETVLGYNIESLFVPSSIVSGDMFGCFPLNDDKLGFYAVDVSGHGVHASLLSVAIGHLITPEFFLNKAFDEDGKANPAALVQSLNQRFSVSDNDDYFTMFCGVFEKSTGRLDFCQAGYPSPLYVGADGTTHAVGSGGFPVGMIDRASFENHTQNIEIDAALIFCSDAACEAENFAMQPFGHARIQKVAEELPNVGLQQFPNNLVTQLNEWRGGGPLEDDLTIVAIQRIN